MTPRRFGCILALAGALLTASRAHSQDRIDAAFQKFWAARSPAEAARDNDRTMLYGAELKIKLTR